MLRNVEGSDSSVQGTNDEAQVSKLSCATLGYYKDDFIKYFVRKHTRRSPLINRGYFSRYSAISKVFREFLAAAEAAGLPAQVLCLGAGFDTRWFQMLSENGKPMYKCLEVDFIEVTQRKASIIKREPALSSLLIKSACVDGATLSTEGVPNSSSASSTYPTNVHIDPNHGEIFSPFYTLMAVDLRKADKLDAAMEKAGFDFSMPTLILSECVLIYLEASHASAVLSHLAQKFHRAAAVAIYEQVKPDDAFGRQMVLNLELRGCPLRSLSAVPTLEAHKQRLLDCGWSRSYAHDMDELYRLFVDPKEQARAERLEIFDEFEEWHLIQEHYSIALGVNDAEGILKNLGLHLRDGGGGKEERGGCDRGSSGEWIPSTGGCERAGDTAGMYYNSSYRGSNDVNTTLASNSSNNSTAGINCSGNGNAIGNPKRMAIPLQSSRPQGFSGSPPPPPRMGAGFLSSSPPPPPTALSRSPPPFHGSLPGLLHPGNGQKRGGGNVPLPSLSVKPIPSPTTANASISMPPPSLSTKGNI